jgi:hypothetical protein
MTPASSTAVCAQRGLFEELLDGTYDCIDRVVLRAYFQLAQEPAGFRIWWRRWMGSDDGLDNTHLMRVAGRFARRVRGWAAARGVPILFSKAGERNEDLAAPHRPQDPYFEGTFAIVVNRAPGNVWNVEHTADGRIRRIKRKEPKAWVNHYAFHILDRDWGHLIIRFCPHPPFNALVILNGHEWVARRALRQGLAFTKEDNCFTEFSHARDLGRIADTLSSSKNSIGRLVQAPERWIYSAVLCFAMDTAEQDRTGFRYRYSLYQAEYSRNLLFTSGRQMDQVFSALVDRVRGPLDVRTVKTLFGRRARPKRHKGQPQPPALEVSLETPAYDLTILRIRLGRLALKIYTKGERVLRIEAMAHNARDLRCRLRADYFPEAVAALRKMVERFVEVLDCLNTAFVEVGLLDDLSQPGRLGAVRVGGIDLNRPRIRAVMNALLALSPSARGFTASEVAARVADSLGDPHYTVSRAAYDLRKFRSKELVSRIPGSRRYTSSATAVAAIAALLLLREKIIRPLLAAASSRTTTPRPRVTSVLDERYRAVHNEMRALCTTVGLAA